MTMGNNELDHLLNFVGYGSLDAPVWFLGMEEAGGGEQNIRTRLKFRVVEDCAEAHQLLGITKHHWGKRVIQRTWCGMCRWKYWTSFMASRFKSSFCGSVRIRKKLPNETLLKVSMILLLPSYQIQYSQMNQKGVSLEERDNGGTNKVQK